jgi:hydrogenase expression/formation protein HypC
MCLGIPGRIVEMSENRGVVEFGTVRRAIDLRLLDHPAIGEYVLVHAGFAINKIDEEEAQKTLDLIEEMELAGAEEQTEQRDEPA